VTVALKKKDFQSDQVVRWCPGCGDYAILAAIQKALPKVGVQRHDVVFVSGIGCSSRFPYYMNTYGFHTIHGRAPAIASGLKIANPNLSVWIVTGDGDGLSIGGNHLLHILRRNIDVTILLFNNKVYGLTKGQYSPTSDQGMRTKSSPMGSVERPVNPIRFAVAAEASFVARTYDTNPKHMAEVFARAAAHKGTSFIEILQNCVIFNKDVFNPFYDRSVRSERMIHLEEGEPLTFGPEGEFGVFLEHSGAVTKPIDASNQSQILVHNSNQNNMVYNNLLATMEYPDYPVPVGIFRQIERPVFETMLEDQVTQAKEANGEGNLEDLFRSGETWKV